MNTLTEGFQEIYFRILNFLVGGRWAMGSGKNLVFHSKFPRGGRHGQGLRKRRGEGKSLQEICFWILNFLVLGVWLGALGRGPQGEEEAGENLFLVRHCLNWKPQLLAF